MMSWGYYPLTKNLTGMLLIPLFMLLLITYAVIKIYHNNKAIRSEKLHDNSIKILNERFSRGEIDEKEYRREKEMLLKS